MRLLHIVRHRTAASAKCILGFIAVASTHEAPPMRARRDRARIKNTSGFYDSTRLMRASNWNSARATTDDVSRAHEHAQVRELRNGRCPEGLALCTAIPDCQRGICRNACTSLFETLVWLNMTINHYNNVYRS